MSLLQSAVTILGDWIKGNMPKSVAEELISLWTHLKMKTISAKMRWLATVSAFRSCKCSRYVRSPMPLIDFVYYRWTLCNTLMLSVSTGFQAIDAYMNAGKTYIWNAGPMISYGFIWKACWMAPATLLALCASTSQWPECPVQNEHWTSTE